MNKGRAKLTVTFLKYPYLYSFRSWRSKYFM